MKKLAIAGIVLALIVVAAVATEDPTLTDMTGTYVFTDVVTDVEGYVYGFTLDGNDYTRTGTSPDRWEDGSEWIELGPGLGGDWGDNGGATTFTLQPAGMQFDKP